MKIARVKLPKKSYDIVITENNPGELIRMVKRLNLGDCAAVITNRKIQTLFSKKVIQPLKQAVGRVISITVADTEKSKSVRTYTKVLDKISRPGKHKRLFIVALGGGVVGDLAGLVAATYKRGVPYLQIPTTLLAQVDSAIGGKVAIDLACGKNLIGSFYQPRLVFSDIEFLKTLNRRQMKSGLAEIIKYGMLGGARFFNYLENNFKSILKNESKTLEYAIWFCSSLKARLVSADEYDAKGKRIILNFGHTIGHALEAASAYAQTLTHGEAVALGMLAACRIGEQLKLCSDEVYFRLRNLLSTVGLPVKIKNLKLEKIIKAQSYDKKFLGSRNRLVLPRKIGKVAVVEGVPLKLIKGAVRELL